MQKHNDLVIVGLLFVALLLSCKSFMPNTAGTTERKAIDFTTLAPPLDVNVLLDKKQTATGTITQSGGIVTLTAADGSKFTLDVPAKALDAETKITMTVVKSIDGAPLDNNAPTAVQLEPSGLVFKEMATLTIVPGKAVPIKEQVVFGFDSDGKDYHLAVIDPKSEEIKIKLVHFSGAGVGSGSDAAWAANLMVQAGSSRTRIMQKLGEVLQPDRIKMLLGGEDSVDAAELEAQVNSILEQFEDQVILKKIAAAELDCQHAQKALDDLLYLGHVRKLLSFPLPPGFAEKALRLNELRSNCPAPYQIVGGLDDWQTSTRVCDIMKPFTLTGSGITMNLSGGLSGTYSYGGGPFGAQGNGTYTISLPDGIRKPGSMVGGGEGSAGGKTGSGTEKYTLTPIEPCS